MGDISEENPKAGIISFKNQSYFESPHSLLLQYWGCHLSSVGVSDAGETKVTLLPVGVDAVALELPQFKRSVESLGVNLDGDGIDDDEHSLHHLLGKAILTTTNEGDRYSEAGETLYTLFTVEDIRQDY